MSEPSPGMPDETSAEPPKLGPDGTPSSGEQRPSRAGLRPRPPGGAASRPPRANRPQPGAERSGRPAPVSKPIDADAGLLAFDTGDDGTIYYRRPDTEPSIEAEEDAPEDAAAATISDVDLSSLMRSGAGPPRRPKRPSPPRPRSPPRHPASPKPTSRPGSPAPSPSPIPRAPRRSIWPRERRRALNAEARKRRARPAFSRSFAASASAGRSWPWSC